MSRVNTCLWFDKDAEEAISLYVSLIPNSKINSIARYPENAPGQPGNVMYVEFELDGIRYGAINGGPHYKLSPAVSISVECADQAEVDRLWDALLAGGGSEQQCGWLTDRFGLSWQIVPKRLMELQKHGSPDVRYRVNQAMFKMVRIDIAEIERAAAG